MERELQTRTGDRPMDPDNEPSRSPTLAQGGHLGVQRSFLDHRLWPHTAEQFVFGDEISGAIDERDQQIERAGTRCKSGAVFQQPSIVGLQLKGPKR